MSRRKSSYFEEISSPQKSVSGRISTFLMSAKLGKGGGKPKDDANILELWKRVKGVDLSPNQSYVETTFYSG